MPRAKEFLVSVADVAFFHNGMLAFTGTTALNTSISVEMSDQEVTGGKGSQLLYTFKYGRRVNPTIEMAEWNLAYIAANVGSDIFEGFRDVFSVAECVTLTDGVGTLAHTPVDNVYVELENGETKTIEPDGVSITVEGVTGVVKVYATYRYSTLTKTVTINSDTAPMVGQLILTAEKHDNKKGKVGEVQIDIPSFQLSGNFEISMEAEGTTTTSMEGNALAIEGASCTDGAVYAYIHEINENATAVEVAEIAAMPAVVTIATGETVNLKVIGIRGGLYSNVELDIKECNITSDESSVASVTEGVISGVGEGTTYINVDYNGVKDVVKVTVTA